MEMYKFIFADTVKDEALSSPPSDPCSRKHLEIRESSCKNHSHYVNEHLVDRPCTCKREHILESKETFLTSILENARNRSSTITYALEPTKPLKEFKWSIAVEIIGTSRESENPIAKYILGTGHPPVKEGGPISWTEMVDKYDNAKTRDEKASMHEKFDESWNFKKPKVRNAAGPWSTDPRRIYNGGFARFHTIEDRKRQRSASPAYDYIEVRKKLKAAESKAQAIKMQLRAAPKEIGPGRLNYILQVDLQGTAGPTVCRVLSCPPHAKFHDLHQAILVAFEWEDYHAWMFSLRDPKNRNMGPPVLTIGDPEFSGDRNIDDCKRTLLYGVMEDLHVSHLALTYLHDFGDNWEHTIKRLGRAEHASETITCVAGEGHAVPDDFGGWLMWEELQAAYINDDGTESHSPDEPRELRERYEEMHDPQGLGRDRLYRWDIEKVNLELAMMKDKRVATPEEINLSPAEDVVSPYRRIIRH